MVRIREKSKLGAFMKNVFKWLEIIAIVAVIVFSMAACSDGSGDGDGGEHWLITQQTTYNFTEGMTISAVTEYNWIKYRYKNETNYEEEYTIYSTTGSTSNYYYSRNGETAESTTQTADGATWTRYYYDSASGLTSNLRTTNASGDTDTSYVIEPLSDIGGIKTYKYYYDDGYGNIGSYNIYTIQNGKTLEIKTFTADDVLVSTTTYTQPDNKVIREKLPDFTLYSSFYASSYSVNSSYQTAEVISDSDSALLIRVRTFNGNVQASQADYLYEKLNPKGNGGSSDFVYYNNETNTITIMRYKGAGGNVIIPEQINGKPVTSIGEWAFDGCTSLKSVTIPAGVTSIVGNVFWGCTSLTSITVDISNPNYSSIDGILYNKAKTEFIIIPKGITNVTIPNGVTSIGVGAFNDCASLKSISIPDSVTSIGSHAFDGCTSLKSITIPDSVTSIASFGEGAFHGCTSVTSITTGNGVTSLNGFYNGVPSLNGGFYMFSFSGYTNLTSITIGNGVTSIEDWAFYGCTKLASVTIGNGVTSIGGGAFSGCTSLKSISIGNSVTTIEGAAFQWCSSLTSITIPDSVTSIGEAVFPCCTSLTSVTIGNSVTSIGQYAFAECPKLTSVTFRGTIPSSGFDADAFYLLGDLREKYLAGGIGTYTTRAPVKYNSVWTKK